MLRGSHKEARALLQESSLLTQHFHLSFFQHHFHGRLSELSAREGLPLTEKELEKCFEEFHQHDRRERVFPLVELELRMKLIQISRKNPNLSCVTSLVNSTNSQLTESMKYLADIHKRVAKVFSLQFGRASASTSTKSRTNQKLITLPLLQFASFLSLFIPTSPPTCQYLFEKSLQKCFYVLHCLSLDQDFACSLLPTRKDQKNSKNTKILQLPPVDSHLTVRSSKRLVTPPENLPITDPAAATIKGGKPCPSHANPPQPILDALNISFSIGTPDLYHQLCTNFALPSNVISTYMASLGLGLFRESAESHERVKYLEESVDGSCVFETCQRLAPTDWSICSISIEGELLVIARLSPPLLFKFSLESRSADESVMNLRLPPEDQTQVDCASSFPKASRYLAAILAESDEITRQGIPLDIPLNFMKFSIDAHPQCRL